MTTAGLTDQGVNPDYCHSQYTQSQMLAGLSGFFGLCVKSCRQTSQQTDKGVNITSLVEVTMVKIDAKLYF